MEIRTDVHADAARVQNEIKTHLGLKSSELVFEYTTREGGKVKLDLITVNPRHNQSFLFRTEVGLDKVDALVKMLDYVKSYRDKEYSYTVQWISKEMRELQTSYFRAKNMYDALDKLYYGRDINTITVYSCVLNPIT
jgi:hypothetical protein